MYTGDIAETNPENGIFSIFGHAATLTFDHRVLWSENLITLLSQMQCWRKFGENPLMRTIDIVETSSQRDGRADARTDTWTYARTDAMKT